MAKNLTHFIETLPDEFDLWNVTYRQDFFTNQLEGFDWLTNNTQVIVSTYFTRQNLVDLYYYAVALIEDPQATLNATVTFFEQVISGQYPQTTTPVSVCKNTFAIDQLFVFWYLYPLIGIVLLMSFFKARKNLCKNILWGRPGVLYPINFIDEYERRWMYTAVFILLANKILFLFGGTFYYSPTIPKNFGFLRVFVVLLNVIILCIEFYPMLACIVMRRNVLANILGVLLTIPWIFVLWVKYDLCPPTRRDATLGIFDEKYYQAIGEILYEVVLFIALFSIILGYLYDLILNIKRYVSSRRKLRNESDTSPLIDTQEELCMVYINSLMKRKPPPKDMPIKEKIKHNLRYARMQGFKYPPRVVCTVLIGLYALYRTATEFTFWLWYISDIGRQMYEDNEEFLVDILNGTRDYELLAIYIRTTQWSVVGSLIASFIIQALLMAHFVSQYRKHIRKFFAGRHTWHYNYTSSPAGVVVSGMRYSGYQVAFLVYGYILVAVVLFVVVMLFAGFIVIPLATKTENPLSTFFIDKFIMLWPAVALGFVLYFIQLLMAKFLFLQENGAFVALTNRRVYHVICYFLFFFNVVLGIFSCLKRILISLVLGTLLISRLDRCLLMRGFEKFDTGFSSYLGMLTVDMYHNHPIVKGFIHILKEEAKASQEAKELIGTEKSDTSEENHEITAKKRVRNKYWKFVTLLNNPSLVLDRLHNDIADMKKVTANGTMATVMDNLGGITSVFFGTGIISEAFDGKDSSITTQL